MTKDKTPIPGAQPISGWVETSKLFDVTQFGSKKDLVSGVMLLLGSKTSPVEFRPTALSHNNVMQLSRRELLLAAAYSTSEKPSPMQDVTHYNNYYEFGTQKDQPAELAQKLVTSPWSVSVEGECANKRKWDIDELRKLAPHEERVYRHRCVERWSMVVPWNGFPLAELIKKAEPTAKAKYVSFESFYDRRIMLNEFSAGISFPYVEGLRMDEAMHPLTLLAFGMYGQTMPKQDGAPVRLVVPWKYGYKSIKSIVKIKFTSGEPRTTWNLSAPNEYGFYSNVNPTVDHPRWSQATEHKLGSLLPVKTQMFNGYGDEVAKLYSGMDLKKFH